MIDPRPSGETVRPQSDPRVVTVVGPTGHLGGYIVDALLKRGVHVRAMVRATSDRTRLQTLGVTDFVVGDLNDAATLRRSMAAEPRATAVVASAAGFSVHSAKTLGDNSKADTDGYRDLIDAVKAARIPRFILISILNCDRAPAIPHFSQKYEAERHLQATGQPYLSLRAGAFIDRSQDMVPGSLAKGEYPDMVQGSPMALLYARDLARYATVAALDLPPSAMNGHVDIGSEVPATGRSVAAAFGTLLGRTIRAKPLVPAWATPLLPLVAVLKPRLRDQIKVLRWVRKGGYVIGDASRQLALFGEVPTVEVTVARYARDKGLVG